MAIMKCIKGYSYNHNNGHRLKKKGFDKREGFRRVC